MKDGNKIREKVNVKEFRGKLDSYGPGNVECSRHTFFRLSDKQRRVFDCQNIRKILFHDLPVLAGLQNNGCYAAFYKHKNKRFIRIILDMKAGRIDVVTLYILEKLPVIR